MVCNLAAYGARRTGLVTLLVVMLTAHVGLAGSCVRSTEEVLDIFAALESEQIEAQIIVRDPFHARLLLKNPTSEPVLVQLPDVLAARPILAQQGLNFFGGQQANTNRASSPAPQAVGGSPMTTTFGQQVGGRPGNGMFSIAPEQVRTVDIACLCLEQGKPNPRSNVKYELVPLAEVNGDPRLAEVLRSHARGEADREIAQAAAWHIAGKLSWERLAGLSQMVAINADAPIFNSLQLRRAKELVDGAASRAAVRGRETASETSAPTRKIDTQTAVERSTTVLPTKEQAVRRRRG